MKKINYMLITLAVSAAVSAFTFNMHCMTGTPPEKRFIKKTRELVAPPASHVVSKGGSLTVGLATGYAAYRGTQALLGDNSWNLLSFLNRSAAASSAEPGSVQPVIPSTPVASGPTPEVKPYSLTITPTMLAIGTGALTGALTVAGTHWMIGDRTRLGTEKVVSGESGESMFASHVNEGLKAINQQITLYYVLGVCTMVYCQFINQLDATPYGECTQKDRMKIFDATHAHLIQDDILVKCRRALEHYAGTITGACTLFSEKLPELLNEIAQVEELYGKKRDEFCHVSMASLPAAIALLGDAQADLLCIDLLARCEILALGVQKGVDVSKEAVSINQIMCGIYNILLKGLKSYNKQALHEIASCYTIRRWLGGR